MREERETKDKVPFEITVEMEFVPGQYQGSRDDHTENEHKNIRYKRMWQPVGMVIAVVVVVMIIVLFPSNEKSSKENLTAKKETISEIVTAHEEIETEQDTENETENETVTTEETTVTMVQVPDVVQMKKSEAVDKLKALGLSVVITDDYNNSIAKGRVIRQNKEPGKKVLTGDTIKIKISKGKKPQPYTQPVTELQTTEWTQPATEAITQPDTWQTQEQTKSSESDEDETWPVYIFE